MPDHPGQKGNNKTFQRNRPDLRVVWLEVNSLRKSLTGGVDLNVPQEKDEHLSEFSCHWPGR